MPSPEFANRFPFAEREEIESVRAVHGVSLIDLLEGENKNCAIVQDPVSIYSIDRPNGIEYAVVFPPLSGQDLHKRLAGISKMQVEILATSDDFTAITHRMQGRLAKAHESRLGVLWEVFSRSLPIQTKVFHDGVYGVYNEETEEERQELKSGQKRKAEDFEALSQLTPKPYAPIMDKERDIIDMLEGNRPVETEELIDFFQLTAKEIAEGRSRDQRINISKNRVIRHMKGRMNKIQPDQWNDLVLRAAKAMVVKNEADPDKNNRYFTGVLHRFARQKIQLPENTVGISRGLEYFTIPKVAGIKAADLVEDDKYIIYFVHHDPNDPIMLHGCVVSPKVFVGESGNINFADESPDEVREDLAKMNEGIIPVSLAVPVVRFLESESGARGFIFNETGHSLPQEVVSEIGERVNRSEKSSKPFEKDWLSGMVGVDMLVIAHPEIRSKKRGEDDNWSSIWGKDRITMSEVMDQEVKQGEPTQFNGPVQVGIIALHALSRYPETFDPFMDNVVSVVKRNESLGKGRPNWGRS